MPSREIIGFRKGQLHICNGWGLLGSGGSGVIGESACPKVGKLFDCPPAKTQQ